MSLVNSFKRGQSNACQDFYTLLRDIQTVPYQSMMVALELATANNYSISTWLTRNNLENHVSPCVIITLQRLVKHINPSIDTTDDLESLLQLLLRIKLYQYVSKGDIETIVTLVSLEFIISHKKRNHQLISSFMSWLCKMKVCMSELSDQVYNGKSKPPDKINILLNVSSNSCDTGHQLSVLEHLIKVLTDFDEPLDSDKLSDLEFSDMDQYNEHVMLLNAALHLKQGNHSKLSACLNFLCDANNQIKQTELITLLGMLLKGEMLLSQDNGSLALTVFNQVIQKDSENIRAFVGVANSFEKMGKYRNELNTWKIICKIQHKLSNSQPEEKQKTILSFTEKLFHILFPFTSIDQVSSLLTLARKSHKLGENEDAAETFLDTLAIANRDSVEVALFIEILQETLLSLLIVEKYDECKIICQHLIEIEDVQERKRRALRSNLVKSVTYFLAGKVGFHTDDFASAMKYFDLSLQHCHLQTEENNQFKKIRIDETDNDELEEDADVQNDLLILIRLRSRIYFEKSVVYQTLSDTKSQVASLKYSLRLHFNPHVYKYYVNNVKEAQKYDLQKSTNETYCDTKNLCIKYMMDFSNIATE